MTDFDTYIDSTCPTSVNVSWTDESLGKGLYNTSYLMRFTAKHVNGSRAVRQINTTSFSVQVNDLLPNTEYDLDVKIISDETHSPWSGKVHFKTLDSAKCYTAAR